MEEVNTAREKGKETSVSSPMLPVLPASVKSLPGTALLPKAIASFLAAGAEGEESPPSTPLQEPQYQTQEVDLVPAVAVEPEP